MKPTLVLVGRPNVGKSTLFNRLTRSRDAIVADIPGLTRDRHYGHGRIGDKPHLVVDTGGFEPVVKEGILHAMAKQTLQAVDEADMVLFIVDGRQGVVAQDKIIADQLRKTGHKILLVVNKTEGMVSAVVTAEFYELGLGEVHFSNSKTGVEGSRTVRFVNAMSTKGIDWEGNITCRRPSKELAKDPRNGVGFADLPGYAMNAANYKGVSKDFLNWVYRNERVEVFFSPLVKEYSKLGESEGEFRGRLSHAAREVRDEAIDKIRDKMRKSIKTKEGQLERAFATLEKEQAEARSAKVQAGSSIIGTVIGMFMGRKSRRSSSGSITSTNRAMKQSGDVRRAERKVDSVKDEINELELELRDEIEQLEDRFDPRTLELEIVKVKPYKKDIDVKHVSLLWVPFDENEKSLA